MWTQRKREAGPVEHFGVLQRRLGAVARATAWAVALLFMWEPSAPAAASERPDRVIDSESVVPAPEKERIDALFQAIRTDTRIEVAAVVASSATSDLDSIGRAEWRWGSNNMPRVLVVVSADGHDCRVVVPDDDPLLTPTVLARVERELSRAGRRGGAAQALRLAAEKIGKTLREGIPVARSPGTRDLSRGVHFAVGAVLTMIAAIAMNRRRSEWRP
jgi:uncharacterized membrane protein YgcG